MQPIYLQIDNNLPLMVVPESDAHMDGHPVLTYSYAIYRNENDIDNTHFVDTAEFLAPDKKTKQNYLGTIVFHQPGKLFSYQADGNEVLSRDEVEQIIEQLTHYRERPDLWKL
jgi:hypothetical protein